MKLNIAYLYPEELNLYGDTGNIEVLVTRSKKRNIEVGIQKVDSKTRIGTNFFKNINIVFMGGGPDSGQKEMYKDLLENKGPYLKEYIENGGVALFICGSYQLMGNYYKSADNTILDGLGIYNIYTQHFGHKSKRCVGNIVCTLSQEILSDPVFSKNNHIGDSIVGFENHGGMTFLENNMTPLGNVTFGNGNNLEDTSEGVYYKNSIGTYFHGPILSKNPHIADFLIAKSLSIDALETLDDTIINKAHSALIARFK